MGELLLYDSSDEIRSMAEMDGECIIAESVCCNKDIEWIADIYRCHHFWYLSKVYARCNISSSFGYRSVVSSIGILHIAASSPAFPDPASPNP